MNESIKTILTLSITACIMIFIILKTWSIVSKKLNQDTKDLMWKALKFVLTGVIAFVTLISTIVELVNKQEPQAGLYFCLIIFVYSFMGFVEYRKAYKEAQNKFQAQIKENKTKDIYKDKYAELKEMLMNQINGDKERFLGIKMKYEEEADAETFNMSVSVSALMVSTLSIGIFSELMELETIFLAIVLIVYVIFVALSFICGNKKRKKARKKLFVLNEIEKELFNQNH